jgi:hypothetical protein
MQIFRARTISQTMRQASRASVDRQIACWSTLSYTLPFLRACSQSLQPVTQRRSFFIDPSIFSEDEPEKTLWEPPCWTTGCPTSRTGHHCNAVPAQVSARGPGQYIRCPNLRRVPFLKYEFCQKVLLYSTALLWHLLIHLTLSAVGLFLVYVLSGFPGDMTRQWCEEKQQ